ncbi:uncharacterized protein LOC131646465 [Vicia villosa]|uniref:uncharacterized protein LOC131646465 n=1 Tax=Vicia villosa TaxID=3911 RepID=UPI00273B69EF|nr:uncharacterized protein LOC131646465 [Vicia villosa]
MARPMEKIIDINDTKELWKVAVRVAHKWKVVSNNKEHFEMIFQDKELANIYHVLCVVDSFCELFAYVIHAVDGCDIHVIVPTACMAAYNEKFEVDHTYTVSNFAVQPNNLLFKPCSHKFFVKFTGGTAVGDVDKHDIPPKPRTFTSFPDIISGNFQKNVLIDVIGMLESIGYQQTQSGGRKLQVNFLLKDSSNNTINCTLWEDYAKAFFKFNKEKPATCDPTVILLQYAKVKEAGQYPLFPKDSLRIVSTQLTSQSQQYSRTSTNENVGNSRAQKLLNGAVSIPLSQMKTFREITFCATYAKTRKLIASSYGWYYQCCHECTKSVRGDKPPYKCDNGHFTEAEIYK